MSKTETKTSKLLSEFGAPETVDVTLPNGDVWKFSGFTTFSAKKRYDAEKEKRVNELLSFKVAADKKGDVNLLPAPFRSVSELIDAENLGIAFDIHSRCIEPKFTFVEAIELCAAPALMSFLETQLSFAQANFLLELRATLYANAKKD